MSITILHNPRCSKSRAAVSLLTERNLEFTIIEYLKTPLDAVAIAELLTQLQLPAEKLIRKTEAIYKSDYKGQSLSEEAWITAMATHPKLIERPVVVVGNKAAIGRPIENITALLDNA